MVAWTKVAVKGTVMQLDIGQLTNGEIEDMEEYAGRPVMGLINRALQEAGSERTVKGKDAMGRELEETVFEIDADVMLDMLPAKVVTALNCITSGARTRASRSTSGATGSSGMMGVRHPPQTLPRSALRTRGSPPRGVPAGTHRTPR